MKQKKIIYISGEGHSGSTLLDIVFGSQQYTFSAGELRFLPEKGIKKGQFCSCGESVPDCEVWAKVIERWERNRILSLDQYIRIQRDLLNNRKLLKARRLLKKKPEVIKNFLKDTENLYELICVITGSDCIVDSSKAPGMIPILKELNFEITVVHLTRRFGHVLNSNKRPPRKKNLEAGIEHDMVPSKTYLVLRSWYLKNFLTKRYSKEAIYKRVKYEDYISNLEKAISKVTDYDSSSLRLLKNRGPFVPEHLVAGNILRMKDEIFVAKKPLNTNYERLGFWDKLLAKTIDSFY